MSDEPREQALFAPDAPITLTDGKEVQLKELDVIELLQAVSYAGEQPSGALVNMTTNLCSIAKIKKKDGQWEDVYPLRSRAEFLVLGKALKAQDILILGAAISARALSAMSDDQKKALAAMLGPQFESSSPTD